jgi:hypothetical protein
MKSNAELNVIAELDLEPIKVKLMHKQSGEGWGRAQVDAVEVEYRRFLHLLKVFPDEQVAPRFDVDIFWHYHILDTLKYAVDCEQVFGYFLHHYPYSALGGEDDEADHHRTGARMQELYEATFDQAYIRQGEGYPVTALPQSAPAYCSPMKAQTEPAYCSPMTATMMSIQRATPMTARPSAVAQNDSVYSHGLPAIAA